MSAIQTLWKYTWRSIFVAFGYVFGLILAEILGAIMGMQMNSSSAGGSLAILFASVILLGIFLGPLASRLELSRIQHFILWGSLIIFNLGSVALGNLGNYKGE